MTTFYYNGKNAKNRLKIQIRDEEGGRHGRMHCHVITTHGTASIDILTLEVYWTRGINVRDLNMIKTVIAQDRDKLHRAWINKNIK